MNKKTFMISDIAPALIQLFVVDAIGGPMPYELYLIGNEDAEALNGEFTYPTKGSFTYELLYFAWLIYFGHVDCKYRKRQHRHELISVGGHDLPDESILLPKTFFPDLYSLAKQMNLAEAGYFVFSEKRYRGTKVWRKLPFKLGREEFSKFYYYRKAEETEFVFYRLRGKKSPHKRTVTCVGKYGLSYKKTRDLQLYKFRVDDGFTRRSTLRLSALQTVPVMEKLLKGYVEN